MNVIKKLILITLLLALCLCKEEQSYRERITKLIHPRRIKLFYKRAIEILSKNTTYPSVSHYGIGVFANKNFRTNEVIMEIPSNFTISSFDNTFPYMNLFDKHFNTTFRMVSQTDRFIFRLLLNINYIRYINNTNRYFRIYFENLPETKDYLPFWGEEKQIFTKLNMDVRQEHSMFSFNSTGYDLMLNTLKQELDRVNRTIVDIMFLDERVKNTINIINTRSFPITLKGWKVINNYSEIDQAGI